MNEAKILAKEFSTPANPLVAVGHKLVASYSYLDKKIRFPPVNGLKFEHTFKKYLPKIIKGELSVAEAIGNASLESGVSLDWLEKYFKGKRYKNWFKARWEELEIAEGVTPGYIIKKHHDNIEGKVKLSLSQLNSLSELASFGILPKVAKIEHTVEDKTASSMDELLKTRDEVNALEAKLKNAIETTAT